MQGQQVSRECIIDTHIITQTMVSFATLVHATRSALVPYLLARGVMQGCPLRYPPFSNPRLQSGSSQWDGSKRVWAREGQM